MARVSERAASPCRVVPRIQSQSSSTGGTAPSGTQSRSGSFNAVIAAPPSQPKTSNFYANPGTRPPATSPGQPQRGVMMANVISSSLTPSVVSTTQPTGARVASIRAPNGIVSDKQPFAPASNRSSDGDHLLLQAAELKLALAEAQAAKAEADKKLALAEAQAAKAEADKQIALAEAQAVRAEAALLAASANGHRTSNKQAPIGDDIRRSSSKQNLIPPPLSVSYEHASDVIGQVSENVLDEHYDVVVVGGGPVGVAAAMKAAVLGHRCIIVDKPKVQPMPDGLDVSFGGPTGLWSKALRDIGKHVDVPSLQSMHLDDEVIWHQVRNMCLRLASANASFQVRAMNKFKIAYLQASATVVSSKNVLVNRGQGTDPAILMTDYVIVATGSKPMRPKEIPFDDFRIFDSDTINSLSFLPKSVAVLGSGIIAIEYAKILRKLGSKVYMLVRSGCMSALERIGMDKDVAEKLMQVLRSDDVVICEHTTVVDWDVPRSREDGPITLKLQSKTEVPSQISVDIFLAATGRVPNTSGWGAEKLGLELEAKGGHVKVNEAYETSVPGIYAVGDVIGPPSLASTGVFQAQAAILEMFHQGHMNKFSSYPVGMWTTPECGYYGMTLKTATSKGIEAKEGCAAYDFCLRGRVFAPEGLLKLVFRVSDGVIIGVHILGEDACELVHYGMDLVKQEVSIFTVMTTCFTAVTFHELFKEAALNGNEQLEFGLEWHKILEDIGSHIDNHEHGLNIEKMKEIWQAADEDGSGTLDDKELLNVFHKYGCEITRTTAANLVRLSAKAGQQAIEWEDFYKIFDILEDVRANSHFGKSKSQ